METEGDLGQKLIDMRGLQDQVAKLQIENKRLTDRLIGLEDETRKLRITKIEYQAQIEIYEEVIDKVLEKIKN